MSCSIEVILYCCSIPYSCLRVLSLPTVNLAAAPPKPKPEGNYLEKQHRHQAVVLISLAPDRVCCRRGVRPATSQNSGSHHCFVCRTSAFGNLAVLHASHPPQDTSVLASCCPLVEQARLMLLSSPYPAAPARLFHHCRGGNQETPPVQHARILHQSHQVHMNASVRIFYPPVLFKSTFII